MERAAEQIASIQHNTRLNDTGLNKRLLTVFVPY
jgi:hypothetical protein